MNNIKKHKKILIVILCFTLIINTFVFSVEKADAFAPAIVAPAVVACGLLVAMGYSYLTTGDVNSVYNNLPTNIKDALNLKDIAIKNSALGVGAITVGSTVVDYFTEEFGSGELQNFNTITGYEAVNSKNVGILASSIMSGYASSYGNAIIVGTPLGTSLTVIGSNVPFTLRQDTTYPDRLSVYTTGNIYSQNITQQYDSGTNSVIAVASALSTSTGTTPRIAYNWFRTGSTGYETKCLGKTSTMPLYDKTGVTLLGYLGVPPIPTYQYTNTTSDLQRDSSGNVTFSIPYNSTPTISNDAPDVIGVDTVLEGIDDLDAFFAGGGVITLADGTLIQGATGTNSISNTEVQQLQDALIQNELTTTDRILAGLRSIGTTITGGISGILNGIWEWLQELGATLTSWWTAFWDWCGNLVTSIGLAIVDSLVLFFGMPTGFGMDLFNDFRGRFSPAFDQFLDKLQVTFSDGTLEDITGTVSIGGVSTTGTLVNFDGLREFLPTFKAWFAGLIYFLLAWYNIKQFQALIYGTSSMPGNMSVNLQISDPTQTDLSHYNGIGGKK